MTMIELLDHFINKYEEMVDIAEVQMMDGNNAWYKEQKEAQNKVDALNEVKAVLTKALEKRRMKRKANDWEVWISDRPNIGRVCCSNYRAMLVVDRDHTVKAVFWTPELKEKYGVENSHRALMDYLIEKYRDENDCCSLILQLRWGGFYTCGLGNGQQEQLTLYGESSDYRHTVNSDLVKNAFLNNKPFELGFARSFWEIISGMTDEELDLYVDSINQ